MRSPGLIRPAGTPRQPQSGGFRRLKPRGSCGPLVDADDALAAVEAVESVVDQVLAVTVIVLGIVIALGEGASWAMWVSITVALVLFGLVAAAAGLEQFKRAATLDFITESRRDSLPLAAVGRQRRRLLPRGSIPEASWRASVQATMASRASPTRLPLVTSSGRCDFHPEWNYAIKPRTYL